MYDIYIYIYYIILHICYRQIDVIRLGIFIYTHTHTHIYVILSN